METDDQLRQQGEQLREIDDEVDTLFTEQEARAKRLDLAAERLRSLADCLNKQVVIPTGGSVERPVRLCIPSDLAAAIGCLDKETRRRLDNDYLRSIPAIPPLDALDRFVLVTIGCLVALTEFVLIGFPADGRHGAGRELPGIGWVAERVKEWKIDSDNWLSDLCHVPYDHSIITDAGLTPMNHRMMSFGHDPSPFGFVVGLVDIVRGHMTGMKSDGRLLFLIGDGTTAIPLLQAPLIWIGHLLSDIATPMGLPVPGSTILQAITRTFAVDGQEMTVAEIARQAYLHGFDFRHYLLAGIVPGLVEGVIHLYHWLRYAPATTNCLILSNFAERRVAQITEQARLTALQFWGHALASGVNAGRVILRGTTGGLFDAVMNINLLQWQTFVIRTIQYIDARRRDTTIDQVLSNRRWLEQRWIALEQEHLTMQKYGATDAIEQRQPIILNS